MKQIDRKTDGIHGLIALRLMLMILLSVSAIAPMIAQQELILKDSIGTGNNTTANGDLNIPAGVSVDSDGNVFITEFAGDRVSKFDKNGSFVTTFGSLGTSDGQMEEPLAIATDTEGNVYVVDSKNNRVQKFDNDGNYLSQFGSAGNGDGEFDRPVGLAIDAAGNIYVSDQNNDRIQKFNANGDFIKAFGATGTPDLNAPVYLAVDSQANVYVSDTNLDQVVKYDSTGNVLTTYGTSGVNVGDGNFENPKGVAVDGQDNLYVVDSKDSIQVFDNSGSFVSKFETPTDDTETITFDSNGSLYIVDFNGNKVYIYSTAQEINLLQGATEVASEGTVDFDSVVIGASSSLEFTIENLGGIDLAFSGTTGSQVALSGDHAADFSVTQTEVGDDLEGFSSVSFTVTYTPATLGSNTATLTINSNDEDEGTYTVDLTGIAVAADNGGDNEDDNPLSVTNENKIGIYPNPAVEVVSIADASVKYAVVYNLMGAKVYAAELENGTLNVKSLRKGLYVLTLMDGVGNILSTNRLMKE